MKQNSKLQLSATFIYCITAVLFEIFFVYMALCENVSVFSSREGHHFEQITEYAAEQTAVPDAPAGIENAYRWTLDLNDAGPNCLCFYLSHQNVHVSISGETVYSLETMKTNRLGDTVSSNWVTVPLHPSDHGKEIVVTLTPLYESAVDFTPQFMVGSHFAIIFDQLRADAPQLVISLLSILLGCFIILFHLYFIIRMQTKSLNLFYLGSFALMLGLWRITDVKSAPIIFSGNPMALGYISIGSLFLCTIPLPLFVSTLFTSKRASPLLILSIISSVISLTVLLLQVFSPLNFNEVLALSHMMLIAAVALALILIFCSRRDARDRRPRITWNIFIVLSASILIDLILYYVTNTSSHILFSLIAFVFYSLVLFITTILETTKKAYVDPRTGLQNALWWNERMSEDTPVSASTGIIMIDLNDLKGVNDAHGHEAGDQMIAQFANILRNTFPSSSLICRWGGDEFTILTSSMNDQQMERYMDSLRRAVDEHNQNKDNTPIHFAMGHALSADYPNLTRRELWSVADSKMYLDKQKWHREHGSSHA
ncbi:MAG: GGDEF domain-containing protein [Clostridia bacterium]|nr:GGDEF domain-containing protein [Clostridia bacterium]